MSVQASDSTIGSSVLGRYRVVRKLARGGMGAVYLARTEGAEGFARPVVVKRVLPTLMDDQEVAQMFVREARILSELQHPNIVPVLDFGQDRDGAYVMVLDYVNGYHMGQWSRYCQKFRDGIPADIALYIMGRVLEALHYAHTLTRADGKVLQIIHRDVTPSNVLLDLQGNVKLLDFGIARVSGDETGIVTQRPQVKGKLPYLALEIFQGKDPSARSDTYSAGVVLYELLTGQNPFMGRETADIFHKVLNANLSSVHAVRDDAPEEIDEVLARAVNRDPSVRYQTAAEFGEALAALRKRSDSVIAEDLRNQLRQDFQGQMPKELKLEPLSVRDAAWRGPVPGGLSDFAPAPKPGELQMPITEDLVSQGDVPTVQAEVMEGQMTGGSADQKVTVPPPRRSKANMPAVQLQSDDPPAVIQGTPLRPPGQPSPSSAVVKLLSDEDTKPVRLASDPPAARPPVPAGLAEATNAEAAEAPPAAASRPQGRGVALWLVATLAVAVSGAALWFSLEKNLGDGDRKIVVIERQDVAKTAEPSAPVAADSPPSEETGDGPGAEDEAPPDDPAAAPGGAEEDIEAAAPDEPTAAAPKRSEPNPRALSRRFGRKQAQIERCFSKHAKGLEGRPKLAVQFQISRAGRVEAARLDPPATAGTPLGACVLEVARSTQFGPQTREFSFRIPITARVVQ